MKSISYGRLVYSIIAVWAIALGMLFVFELIDVRRLTWDAELLAAAEPDKVRELLGIYTDYIGGLLIGLGAIIALSTWTDYLATGTSRNLLSFSACLVVLVTQLYAWIQLGLPITRIALLAGLIALVVVAYRLESHAAKGRSDGD